MNREKEQIENIQDKRLKNEELLDIFSKFMDLILIMFPNYGSLTMEFIQNADDAHSNYIKFIISEKSIEIINDGDIFSKTDINSICGIGDSSKSLENYIGYLGV